MSDSTASANPAPVVLKSERLTLRLANPNVDEDCELIIRFYTEQTSSRGGNARVGVSTIEDVRQKHRVHGARAELCTLQPPPYGIIFMIFSPRSAEQIAANEQTEFPEGNYAGGIGMSFRKEMPYPDIGFGIFGPYEGKGYASEAGRRVLQFWRDEIGLKEVFAAALDHNQRSLRTSERIGLVRAGRIFVHFGKGDEVKSIAGTAMVLPGMKWNDYDKDGNPTAIWPTVGNETEAQKQDDLTASSRG